MDILWNTSGPISNFVISQSTQVSMIKIQRQKWRISTVLCFSGVYVLNPTRDKIHTFLFKRNGLHYNLKSQPFSHFPKPLCYQPYSIQFPRDSNSGGLIPARPGSGELVVAAAAGGSAYGPDTSAHVQKCCMCTQAHAHPRTNMYWQVLKPAPGLKPTNNKGTISSNSK